MSRTLNESEINYSTVEKELLAIIYGCAKFRPYLFWKHFKIKTDHDGDSNFRNTTIQ